MDDAGRAGCAQVARPRRRDAAATAVGAAALLFLTGLAMVGCTGEPPETGDGMTSASELPTPAAPAPAATDTIASTPTPTASTPTPAPTPIGTVGDIVDIGPAEHAMGTTERRADGVLLYTVAPEDTIYAIVPRFAGLRKIDLLSVNFSFSDYNDMQPGDVLEIRRR